MRTSQRGIDLIKEFEGFRAEAYRDSVGVLTIGYGHTAEAGPPIPRAGMVITPERGEEILRADLGQYEAAVRKAITRQPTQPQFDAMVSFCFNVGPGNFRQSSVRRHFNYGSVHDAADAFLLWNKAGGKVLRGLTRRRQAERDLFLSEPEDWPSIRWPMPPDVPPAPKPAPRGFWARLCRWWRYL